MIPGSANSLLLASAAAAGDPVEIERSLRFNSADSAYLSRTPGTAGNRKTWTWAGWVKLGSVGTVRQIFTARTSGTPYALFYIYSDDKINFADSSLNSRTTAAVYRDPSAWYHIQLTIDTTDATAVNRVRLWVNGTLQTWASTTAPTQNADGQINTATAHSIGSPQPYANNEYFSGYLADIHFIDGQALTPSSFTGVSATTGQLIPLAYSGSYGTNGFKLKFSDNSAATAATLGADTSGNGNNWTPNNLSVTAGAGNDSLVDTPTSISATDTGVGGEVRGNYCTWNPLSKGTDVTLANGNLDMISSSTGGNTTCSSTFGVSSGKWYWEVTCTGSDPRNGIGVVKNDVNLNAYLGSDSSGWGYSWNAYKYNNGVGSSYGASHTANDVIGVALDADSGTLTFYKNGASQGQAYSNLTSGPFFPAIADDSSGSVAGGSLNAGQRPFAYTAPSGFKALCDTNLGAPLVAKPNTLFDTKIYTGNGGTQTISGLAFSPDFVWVKNRSNALSHRWTDVLRGVEQEIGSDYTGAEYYQPGGLSSFNADGFTVGSNNGSNASGNTYVAWTWDAGTSTVSNTAGSITSQVRANVSAGFSVVTYTGNNTAGATVGHGLGVAPALIINKQRSGTNNWWTYHASLGATKYLVLDLTNAAATANTVWNDTAPTSTVFSIGVTGVTNTNSATYVNYCFAPVVGYSSFGSYTGNGSSDGPFVFTGMRPRWILLKRTDAASNSWRIYDAARDPYNQAGIELYPNDSSAEYNGFGIDFLGNGFKLRNSSYPNASGGTYIYYAVAENPFQYARAR